MSCWGSGRRHVSPVTLRGSGRSVCGYVIWCCRDATPPVIHSLYVGYGTGILASGQVHLCSAVSVVLSELCVRIDVYTTVLCSQRGCVARLASVGVIGACECPLFSSLCSPFLFRMTLYYCDLHLFVYFSCVLSLDLLVIVLNIFFVICFVVESIGQDNGDIPVRRRWWGSRSGPASG